MIMLLLNIFLWLLTVIFALILLILILPINLEICYENGKFDLKIKVWFLRVDTLGKWFLNRKNKKSKDSGKREKNNKKEKNHKKLASIQSTAKYVKAFLSSLGKIMKMVFKSMVFERFNLKIIVGSEEASKTATTYGAVCMAVYPAASAFLEFNEPKNYSIYVTPDFVSEKIRIFLGLKIKTRIISLLVVAIKAFIIINSKLK
ncbi:MAG: DUF2953 domain-containing protein [Clostridia bacterium]|nr:DUF2953 domain-containing protein [Clostridia bacterium]